MIERRQVARSRPKDQFVADLGQEQRPSLGLPSAHIRECFHRCKMVQIYYYMAEIHWINVSAMHLNPLLFMQSIL